MKFDKLVRDKIPAIIQKKGKQAIFHQADESEYLTFLTDKLQEEVDEFMADYHIEELADIVEVIHAICQFKGISLQELEETRLKKAQERGGFTKRIVLDEVKE